MLMQTKLFTKGEESENLKRRNIFLNTYNNEKNMSFISGGNLYGSVCFGKE